LGKFPPNCIPLQHSILVVRINPKAKSNKYKWMVVSISNIEKVKKVREMDG